ncbi:MAG: TatD family hydrolase [Bacteroidales bacterium]|nr:TatD family hydrolase [Bacteroidales bacterium]
MNFPVTNDYIDIHTHDSGPIPGIFSVENLMAHESKSPVDAPGLAFTSGIHPWYLSEINHNKLIDNVLKTITHPSVVAVGEAGFDKIKGPLLELQRRTFEEQVTVAEEHKKPVVIHCVRAWDELLSERKKLRPKMPWLIHGFRGNKELAFQLISKGMYLSFWFDFVMRPESADLLRSLPADRIFLETDGAEVNIKDIYLKVALDLRLDLDELKVLILNNFNKFFNLK